MRTPGPKARNSCEIASEVVHWFTLITTVLQRKSILTAQRFMMSRKRYSNSLSQKIALQLQSGEITRAEVCTVVKATQVAIEGLKKSICSESCKLKRIRATLTE